MSTPQRETSGVAALSVEERAKKEGALDEARAESVRSDMFNRKFMVVVLAFLFLVANAAVFTLVFEAFHEDVALLTSAHPISPAERPVTPHVLMALIGGTVVQVGAAIIAIVGYLFPKARAQDRD